MASALRKRSTAKRLLVVFALSVFVPAVALAVLAYGGVARERRALTAERAGALSALGTRIRGDLSDALDKLRRNEEARPWFHYNALYFEPGQVGQGLNYQPSPLASGNDSVLVETWSHFQIDPAGNVAGPVPPETAVQEDDMQTTQIRDGILESNEILAEVQRRVVPRVKERQEQVETDGQGKFPEEVDNNQRQWTNRKGTMANQQSAEAVQEIIEGKKQELADEKRGPDEEILPVEVSGLRFSALPDFGILAYRYVDAPNETGAYGGQPVLRFVQGFKLDLDHIRGTLFPDLVTHNRDVIGAGVELLPASQPTEGSGIAFEEPVPLLPGYRVVVQDRDPDWVATRVAQLSRLLIGAAGLLLLVIAGGLTFTLRAVKQEVDLAERKSDFVAAVTHELRTPLTGIKMYADMLNAGWVKDEPTRDEYVGFMAAETDRLARLVNRVLDFARSDRGRRSVEPIRLEEPVREVERDFGPHVRERSFALSVLIETDREAMADPDAVKQILLNLLENALKYAADSGEKRIEVVVAEANESVVLDVIDHGPGVPAAERERIFEDFYRPGEELTREAPGAGLGLALVRRMVESMGGTVEVLPTPGGGATFRVRLKPAVSR